MSFFAGRTELMLFRHLVTDACGRALRMDRGEVVAPRRASSAEMVEHLQKLDPRWTRERFENAYAKHTDLKACGDYDDATGNLEWNIGLTLEVARQIDVKFR